MDRGRGNVVHFLEHSREKTQRVSNEDGSTRLMELGQSFVPEPQLGAHRIQHELKAAPWVPDVRVLRDGVVLFGRDSLFKDQAGMPYDVAERPRGEHDDLVATGFQRSPDAHKRMHIPARSDGGHDEPHQCKVNHMTHLNTIGQIATAVKDLTGLSPSIATCSGCGFCFRFHPAWPSSIAEVCV